MTDRSATTTNLLVAMLRITAGRLRAGASDQFTEICPGALDQVARASIESGRDSRNLTATRDQKGT